MQIFLEDILINSPGEASFLSFIPRLLCVGVAWDIWKLKNSVES